ncbi:MAG: hypothetical protein KTR35_22385 [Gammaproteobacteria bacterium]|nr:hypothetical protein [Gammaproteobacteria bacterium]
MTDNSTLRENNWESYARVLEAHTTIRTKKEIKKAKPAYLGDAPLADLPTNFSKLILAPEINDDTLAEIEDGFRSDRDRWDLKRRIIKLQRDRYFYFGKNSFFGGKEKVIYDYFEFDKQLENFTFTEGMRQEYDLSSFTRMGQYGFAKILFSISVEDHLQLDRSVQDWYYRLRALPSDLKYPERNEQNERLMCGIEWVTRHPDDFRQPIVEIAQRIKEIFTDNSMPECVTSYYQSALDTYFDDYVKSSCAGGTLTVCVEYESEDHLSAMLEVLNPETRYPYEDKQEEGRVHHLLARDGHIRVPQEIIHSMWKAGTVVDNHKIIDKTKLICTLKTGLSLQATTQGLQGLAFDARNLVERYHAKPPAPGDAISADAKKVAVTAVIEPIEGAWSAGYILPGLFRDVESRPGLAKLAQAAANPTELAIELLSDKHDKLILAD